MPVRRLCQELPIFSTDRRRGTSAFDGAFDAASIRQYAAMVLPGLLQTREYAGEVLRAIRPDADAAEVEQRLDLRMHRQELVTQQGAPDL
jgi:hypothetical protein